MTIEGTRTPAVGQPIPTPPDFPVYWDDPGDAKLIWELNGVLKEPVPLLVDTVVSAFLVGNNAGFEKAALPFYLRTARVNTYLYMAMVPAEAPPEVAMKAMGLLNRAAPGAFKVVMEKMGARMSKKAEVALDALIADFETYWYGELSPEIKEHIAYFESIDLRGLSLEQLRAHLDEALKRTVRMGALHGVVIPMLYAMSQFEELYCELFDGATTLDALRLTQGLDNKTMAGNRALWELSHAAASTPEVAATLTGQAAGDVIPALEKSEAGQSFLAGLRAWLAEYGRRLHSISSLAEPSWFEDPAPAIQSLQAYLALSGRRPEMDIATLAAEREQAVAEARARLAHYPQPVVDRFEALLKAAQVATIVHEDHNFWIDQQLFYHIRQLILEFGRRLTQAGSLDAVDYVFHLATGELKDGRDADLKGLVQQRKAELERFRQVSPPPQLGTMPPFAMEGGGPIMRAMFKGEMAAPIKGESAANTVKGFAGSAGVARGPARVIRSLAEAGKLEPGDVLVAPATEPPWTPLFATAAAVVTDNGGVLSHTAVVAREFRIPAVVGTGEATSPLQDGQLIEVDGNAGIVRVIVEVEDSEREPALVG
jgi:phosphohistidine swiveling domain-containing protein